MPRCDDRRNRTGERGVPREQPRRRRREAVLANAAVGGFGGLFPSAELGRLAKALVRGPKPVARRVIDLAARLGQVGIGVPDQPGARDRRFADRAWAGNPVLQRLALGYLATCDAASGILEDAEVDWRTRERLRLTSSTTSTAAALAHERPAHEP